MSQVVVTFENGADSTFLRKIIENLKGVIRVSAPINHDEILDEGKAEWIKKMVDLSNEFDPSAIDMSDDRTKYIMSK